MTMVKRVCDTKGCTQWSVVCLRMERDDGELLGRRHVCQAHLDELKVVAEERDIEVIDER